MDELKELFESIQSDLLNEEIQLKICTLFESAVNEAIAQKELQLEEQNKAQITEFKEELVENVDSYLEYFVTSYIKENEGVVEDFTKVRLAEKVLRNFQQMTEAFNISLSDESVSSEDEIEELQSENTKLVNKLIESRKEIQNIKKAAMISEACQKLETDVQRDSLVEMAKALDFEEDLFESKLDILIEKITTKKDETIIEKVEDKEGNQPITETKKTSELMKSYLKYF